jgi:hypothetical protein
VPEARLGQKQALWWNDGIAKYFWVLVPLYDCPLFQSTGSIYTERAEITAISAILPYLPTPHIFCGSPHTLVVASAATLLLYYILLKV